jgi:hypothetical protein
MRPEDGGRRAKPWVGILAMTAALALGRTAAADMPANVRLSDPAQRLAMAQAVQGAAHQLERSECEGLLDEFNDASGRSLRAALHDEGLSVAEFLARVLFYDATPEACRSSALAGMSVPGQRVVRVCGRRFQRTMDKSRDHAEAMVIHEMLHALGLGENPPTSDHITTRVLARCGR